MKHRIIVLYLFSRSTFFSQEITERMVLACVSRMLGFDSGSTAENALPVNLFLYHLPLLFPFSSRRANPCMLFAPFSPPRTCVLTSSNVFPCLLYCLFWIFLVFVSSHVSSLWSAWSSCLEKTS